MQIVTGTAVFIFIFVMVMVVRRWAYVRVPETEVGVVDGRGSGRFMRFLPPGGHWLLPFREQVVARIDTSPPTIKGKTDGLQTIGGLSLTISWRVSFSLNPLRVPRDAQGKIARKLVKKTAVTARNHTANILHHLIGRYTIEQLTEPDAHQKLEAVLLREVRRRLYPLGYDVSRVMIGAIDMPPQVKSALEAAHKQAMQTEIEARALARLQQVISRFSDADMERLIELERIHKLGQAGVVVPYPSYPPYSTVDRPAVNGRG